MFPAFLAFAVIPFGEPVTLFGRTVPFQLADLNIGILWVLAMTSIGVYARGAGRLVERLELPAARLRPLERADDLATRWRMGLALVAVLMYCGSPADDRDRRRSRTRSGTSIPQFPAFVVFLICGLAETNRPPFDLAEAESELVAGFHTEYSGIKFAMFFLGEYVNTVTVAAVARDVVPGRLARAAPGRSCSWLWPLLWFLFKVTAVIYVYILVRATLPRMRYDRLMNFGWKVLIPFGLVWVHGDRVRRRAARRSTATARSCSRAPRSCSACSCSPC